MEKAVVSAPQDTESVLQSRASPSSQLTWNSTGYRPPSFKIVGLVLELKWCEERVLLPAQVRPRKIESDQYEI